MNRLWSSPYFLLVLATMFWAGNFVIGRAVHLEVPPIGLSFWRWGGALIIVIPFAWSHLRDQRVPIGESWRILVVLGALGVGCFSTFVYIGLHSTTATNAVLIMSTVPVTIVGLSRLLLKESITARQGVGILTSFLGVMIIIIKGHPELLFELRLGVGDLWILGAVFSWALYSVLLKWRPLGLHPLGFLASTIMVGLAMLLPLYGWERISGVRMNADIVTIASVTYLALFPSVLAFVFWNRAVSEIGPNRAGLFIHLVPAFGTVLSMVFLGESLYGFHLVGITLICFGIFLTTSGRSRRVGLRW